MVMQDQCSIGNSSCLEMTKTVFAPRRVEKQTTRSFDCCVHTPLHLALVSAWSFLSGSRRTQDCAA
eukprot:5995128-Pleurochrysis_carterae.AAC.1